MTITPPLHRRYVAIEALIGGVISAALSVIFAVLVFAGFRNIPLTGPHGLIIDAVPQGLAIAFMATLIPTLLTRRRTARGAVPPILGKDLGPRRVLVRAILAALVGAVLSVSLTFIIYSLGILVVPFLLTIVVKACWGFLLGAIVAAVMTRWALVQDR